MQVNQNLSSDVAKALAVDEYYKSYAPNRWNQISQMSFLSLTISFKGKAKRRSSACPLAFATPISRSSAINLRNLWRSIEWNAISARIWFCGKRIEDARCAAIASKSFTRQRFATRAAGGFRFKTWRVSMGVWVPTESTLTSSSTRRAWNCATAFRSILHSISAQFSRTSRRKSKFCHKSWAKLALATSSFWCSSWRKRIQNFTLTAAYKSNQNQVKMNLQTMRSSYWQCLWK